ncbi:MAG: hypothetical protein M1829_001211 [Trizodia sp. TS-e1964]|nr:MAG: hypothetical protein M1829_001211 [Trizodia sp. TS-e1964]
MVRAAAPQALSRRPLTLTLPMLVRIVQIIKEYGARSRRAGLRFADATRSTAVGGRGRCKSDSSLPFTPFTPLQNAFGSAVEPASLSPSESQASLEEWQTFFDSFDYASFLSSPGAEPVYANNIADAACYPSDGVNETSTASLCMHFPPQQDLDLLDIASLLSEDYRANALTNAPLCLLDSDDAGGHAAEQGQKQSGLPVAVPESSVARPAGSFDLLSSGGGGGVRNGISSGTPSDLDELAPTHNPGQAYRSSSQHVSSPVGSGGGAFMPSNASALSQTTYESGLAGTCISSGYDCHHHHHLYQQFNSRPRLQASLPIAQAATTALTTTISKAPAHCSPLRLVTGPPLIHSPPASPAATSSALTSIYDPAMPGDPQTTPPDRSPVSPMSATSVYTPSTLSNILNPLERDTNTTKPMLVSRCSMDTSPSPIASLIPRRHPVSVRRPEPPRNENNQLICEHADCIQSPIVFPRKCEWSKHMDKHERPYRCNEPGCEKLQGFTYSGGLLRHEREVHKKHGGPKIPLMCPHTNCKRSSGAGFTRQENLNEHLRRVHKADDSQKHESSVERDLPSDDAESLRAPPHKRKRSATDSDPFSDRSDDGETLQAQIKRLKTENEAMRREANELRVAAGRTDRELREMREWMIQLRGQQQQQQQQQEQHR